MKKIMSLVISGALILSGCISVFASDAAAGETEVSQAAGDDLGALLDALGSEEGLGELLNSLGSEEGLDELLNSLGSEEGLGELLGSLGSEAGLDDLLNSVIGEGSEISGLLESIGLGNLSEEDLAGLGEMLNDPEALKEMASGLLGKDGMGTFILDMIAGEGGALGSVLEGLKTDDGGYDVDKVMETLETIEEKDASVVINGTEIPQEEIEKAAGDVMGFFAMMGAMETESEAA